MTEPPGLESPFASIRELTATERRLTATIEAVKNELLAAIRVESAGHDATHKAMREIGDLRHRRIEDFMGADALDEAKRTGMMAAGVVVVRVFRFLNEFRWVFAGLALLLGLLLGGIHVTFEPQVAR